MKTKLVASIILLSLLISIPAFVVRIQPVAAANEYVMLSVNPPSVTQNPPINPPESFFDVYLDISDVTDLFGFDIEVTWTDNTLITLDHDAYNATLNAIWGVGNWFVVMNVTGGGGGGGSYRLAALSTAGSFTGTHTLFQMHFKILRNCNFLLQTTIGVGLYKLSDSLWQPIPVNSKQGCVFSMNPTQPDLELELYEPDPAKKFEYCKTFQVKVYVTHICANLKDYVIHIQYTSELLKFTGIEWGVLGDTSDGASFINATGEVQVQDTGGLHYSGEKGLLFTLTFHVEFDDREEHIWRVGHPQNLPAEISIQVDVGLELSFDEGVIPISDVLLVGTPIPLTIYLIRGDVGPVDGKVSAWQDLRTVAAYYDQSAPVKYDITGDGTIDIYDLVAVATNIGYGGP
jgi:hypothetical protein